MTEFIVQAVVGVVIIVIGILNIKGNITMLHSYHRKKVKEEDIIPEYKNQDLDIVDSVDATSSKISQAETLGNSSNNSRAHSSCSSSYCNFNHNNTNLN